MASGRMEFHAESIMQHANFSFVLANDVPMEEVPDEHMYDRPPKTLILLHGLTGTDTDWLYGGVAQIMSIHYNLNIFMPTTGNSFYLDKGYPGANWETFIVEELPEYIHKTFGAGIGRDDLMIGGLSMGGYGALHTAFGHPETFSACIALSSALVIKSLAAGDPDDENNILPEEMVRDIFGDPDALVGSDREPEVMIKKAKASGAPLPELYLACGTDDSLIEKNRAFRDFLGKEGLSFTYEEGPGKHDWVFWNKYLDRGLAAVLKP